LKRFFKIWAHFCGNAAKTGLCGGSVPAHCAVTAWPPMVAPRPFNPLRTNRQHPSGVSSVSAQNSSAHRQVYQSMETSAERKTPRAENYVHGLGIGGRVLRGYE
jgi:hypothetical protein